MGRQLTSEQRQHRAVGEADLQDRFIRELKRRGWEPMHVSDSRRLMNVHGRYVLVGDPACKGWPDIFACHEGTGRQLAVEVKRELEKPTPEQVKWLRVLAACGADTFVLRPSNWHDAMALLDRQAALAA